MGTRSTLVFLILDAIIALDYAFFTGPALAHRPSRHHPGVRHHRPHHQDHAFQHAGGIEPGLCKGRPGQRSPGIDGHQAPCPTQCHDPHRDRGGIWRSAALLAGAVLTESIYRWPGLGAWSASAILALDWNSIMGFTLLVAIIYVLGNLIVDIMYAYLDPRVKLE